MSFDSAFSSSIADPSQTSRAANLLRQSEERCWRPTVKADLLEVGGKLAQCDTPFTRTVATAAGTLDAFQTDWGSGDCLSFSFSNSSSTDSSLCQIGTLRGPSAAGGLSKDGTAVVPTAAKLVTSPAA